MQRNTPAQSDTGELISNWADVDTAVKCRYVQKEMDKAQESLSLQEKVVHMLLMNNGEDVIEEDRVTDIVRRSCGTSVNAGPFTIESVLERNANVASGHHISIKLERVE